MKTKRLITAGIACLLGTTAAVLVDGIRNKPPVSRTQQIAEWIRENEPKPTVFCPDVSDRKFWGKNKLLISKESPKAPQPEMSNKELNAILTSGTNQELTFNTGEWIPAVEAAILALQKSLWSEELHKLEFTDLHATQTGASLARTLCALKPKLNPKVFASARNTLRRKITGPYLKDLKDYQQRRLVWGKDMCPWLETKDNWTAVCVANIIYIGLAVESDPQLRAEFIALSEAPLKQYLASAEDDGYLPSGIRYWNYGFGYLMLLTERLNKATGGNIMLAANPKIERIAGFKAKCLIARSNKAEAYPLFADNDNPVDRNLWVEALCAKYFGTQPPPNPEVEADASVILDLVHSLPKTKPGEGIQPHNQTAFFPSAGVMISRNQWPFVIATKAGHNREEHNHNDIGSYSIFYQGQYLTGDSGTIPYTAEIFGKKRYENDILNSYGHPVPVVGNHLQTNSPSAIGKVVEHQTSEDQDFIRYDLTAAYKTPGLKSLIRTISIRKIKKLEVRITDEFVADRPIKFETAVIHQGGKQYSSTLLINGFNTSFESSGEITLGTSTLWKDKIQISRTGAALITPAKTGHITTIFSPREKPPEVNESRPEPPKTRPAAPTRQRPQPPK